MFKSRLVRIFPMSAVSRLNIVSTSELARAFNNNNSIPCHKNLNLKCCSLFMFSFFDITDKLVSTCMGSLFGRNFMFWTEAG